MATITITRGKTLPNSGTKTDLHDLVDLITASITNIVNADIGANAAIAGTKISPNFGSQAVATTGTLAAGTTTITGNIDLSGDIDVDGTLETDAVTLNGNAVDTAGGLGTYSTLIVHSIKDYGSSASSSSAKAQSALKIAYGYLAQMSSSASQAVTNLPFTSSTSYSVFTGTLEQNQMRIQVTRDSGAQFTLTNRDGGTVTPMWFAIGT